MLTDVQTPFISQAVAGHPLEISQAPLVPLEISQAVAGAFVSWTMVLRAWSLPHRRLAVGHRPVALQPEHLGGNHLSHTTCLTQVFFKGGDESRIKQIRPHQTSSARRVVPPKERQGAVATARHVAPFAFRARSASGVVCRSSESSGISAPLVFALSY